MNIREVALLTLLDSDSENYPIDQIRIMKAFFLLDREGPPELQGLYDFQPYDYGPFDAAVYRDLESLEEHGLIRSSSVGGSRQRIYSLTSEGRTKLDAAASAIGDRSKEALAKTATDVTSMGFATLLRTVYDKYPDFAAKSVFQK